MLTSVGQILKTIDEFFPFETQDTWDNSGLLIGHKSKAVDRILLSLDVTEEVVDEARENGIDLIIAHHPLIFKGLKNITTEDRVGRLITKLIKSDIAVIAAHTNLDKSKRYGINQWIANALELENLNLLIEEELDTGHGIVGYLKAPQKAMDFVAHVKNVFKIDVLKTANFATDGFVRKIAISSGSASEFIENALETQADVYITADLKYHECQRVLGTKLGLFDVGHFESESVYLHHLRDLLESHFNEKNYDLYLGVSKMEKPLLMYL